MTSEEGRPKKKNPDAVTLGRLGGKKGGPARAEKLTPHERSLIARKAAKARWEKEERESVADPWIYRIVGRPSAWEGGAFFVVRENSRNSAAFGPFTMASFPHLYRSTGRRLPAMFRGRAREAIRESLAQSGTS